LLRKIANIYNKCSLREHLAQLRFAAEPVFTLNLPTPSILQVCHMFAKGINIYNKRPNDLWIDVAVRAIAEAQFNAPPQQIELN
jgi:hypothetical protein